MAHGSLQEILDVLADVPKEETELLDAMVNQSHHDQVWVPNPGPQTEAYFCKADELFYGGQAGGGKTDLGLGLALTAHTRSLILRRTTKEVNELVDRMEEILGSRDGWGGVQAGVWRRPGGVLIGLGGCNEEKDKQKYKGIPRDLYYFDEVSDFEKSQYEFIIGWNRSAKRGQRCRVVAGGNPPTRPEGLWVLERWGAWLDPQHPKPAKPGELRWYTTGANGEEIEVEGRGPHWVQGREVYARSRTYLPASLHDNPDLMATSDYQANLDSLPMELRAAYRDGDFSTALKDNPWQVIPTDWVTAAQARWKPQIPAGIPMCAMGVDIAIAKDKYVIQTRHDGWFNKATIVPGREIADAKKQAGRVIAERVDNAKVIVDVGGGWGADCYGHLMKNNIDCVPYMGVKGSTGKTKDGKFAFTNVRTAAFWKFREALDPSQHGGSQIALPPSVTLKADLCAPSYRVKGRQHGAMMEVESKEDVCKRLGRSTDEGDAVIMCYYDGLIQANMEGGWFGGKQGRNIQVHTGRAGSSTRRGRRG